MVIAPRANDSDYTRFMLDDMREPHKIEVFVLEEYLKEKLGITFMSRPFTSGA
jgi:hypothetical protein